MDEIPVEKSPHSVAVHRTRPLVANVNYDADSVTVIDTNTNEVIATVAVGDNPQDITWAADGRFAYVTNVDGDTVSVISAEDFTVSHSQ
jgi:YVTN family beta-propeller protein